MRFSGRHFLVTGICLAITLFAESAFAAEGEVIGRLIAQLGSDTFTKRQNASKQLEKIGKPALAPLRQAMKSEDPEVRRRARQLVDTLERKLFGPMLVLTGHTRKVVSVDVSPDGRLAISGSNDGTARLWDLKSGKQIRTLGGRSGSSWAVAFSPDGKQVLAGSSSGGLGLWEVTSGKKLHTFAKHPAAVRAVAFLPDGKRAISGSYDKKMRLWDLQTGKIIRVFAGHTASIMCVAVSKDGRYGVTGGAQRDQSVRLWDLETGKEVRRFVGHGERVMGVAFSPDGKTIASGCWDETVRIWDARTGKNLKVIKAGQGYLYGVSYVLRHKRPAVASAGRDGTVRLWNPSTGAHLGTLKGHTSNVSELAFSEVSQRILSCSGDRTIRVWPANR